MLAFHATSIGRRQYMLGIVPDEPDRFPYYAIEDHQEMIVVDLNCKDNLANLLNQVMIGTALYQAHTLLDWSIRWLSYKNRLG